MMATTHGFAGLAMAAVVALAAPEVAVPAAVGAIAGGLFPDLDLVAEHRKTLHFPVYYAVLAVPASVLAVAVTRPWTVAAALFLFGAAAHSATDALDGGPGVRPWQHDSSRAVYVHAVGRWARPREWVRYDGAPEDFLVGAALAVPGVLVFDPPISTVAIAGVGVSLAYAAFRKPIGRRLSTGGHD